MEQLSFVFTKHLTAVINQQYLFFIPRQAIDFEGTEKAELSGCRLQGRSVQQLLQQGDMAREQIGNGSFLKLTFVST